MRLQFIYNCKTLREKIYNKKFSRKLAFQIVTLTTIIFNITNLNADSYSTFLYLVGLFYRTLSQ